MSCAFHFIVATSLCFENFLSSFLRCSNITMESYSTFFPTVEDETESLRVPSPVVWGRAAEPMASERSAAPATLEPLELAIAASSGTSDLRQDPHLYSPTRSELESHPIRQRLSEVRDDILPDLNTAPEVPHIFNHWERATAPEEPRLARDVKSSVAETEIMAEPVKEGDNGEYTGVLRFSVSLALLRLVCAQACCFLRFLLPQANSSRALLAA